MRNKLSNITYRKFEESYIVNNRQVLTPTGYKKIIKIHKTIPYNKFRIKTENDFIIFETLPKSLNSETTLLSPVLS